MPDDEITEDIFLGFFSENLYDDDDIDGDEEIIDEYTLSDLPWNWY